MKSLSLIKNSYLKPLFVVGLFMFLIPFGNVVQADTIPTIDITANGVQNSLFVLQNDSFTISWNATNVLTCELSRNGESLGNVISIGQTGIIDQTHPYFPQLNQPANFTITCTDGTNSIFQSVVVSLTPPATPVPPLSAPTLNAQTGSQCGGSIDLTWNSITDATSYLISRDGSQITQLATTSFSDTGLITNSSHIYTVVATNSSTSSPSSLTASAFASDVCPAGPVLQTTVNSHPLDYPTVLVSNFTQFPFSISNWGTTATAQAGDVVAVGIYYHNSGTVNAINTKTSISIPLAVSQNQFTATGGVSADNAPAVSGSATISISNNQALSYVAGSARWYPNQIQDPALGVVLPDYALNNLGTITPGFPSQGLVVAHFQVSNNTATSTVDVTANNQQGPITVSPDGQFTLEWTTSGVLSCTISSTDGAVAPTGITLIGNTASITSGHPYFPTTGTSRTFTVTCLTATGQVSDNVTVNIQQSGAGLSAPTLTASTGAFCGGQVSLSWNAVSGATSYKIFRNGVQITTTTNLSFTDTGLTPSTSFSYSVVASDGTNDSPVSNTSSAQSSAVCATGVPATPTGVQAITGPICGGQISISWIAVAGATSYKVLRDGSQVGIVSSPTTNFVDAVTIDSVHSYSVIASNSFGDSGPSSSVNGTASSACPAGPVGSTTLSGAMGGACGGEIVLSWTTVVSATNYKVFRISGGTTTQITTTTNLSFTDTGLTPSTMYQYFVVVNAGGIDSAPSNIVSPLSSATCGGGGGTPAPVITLIATPNPILVGATSTLTWTSTNATSCASIGGWTLATTTSGNQIVSPATTTAFAITCTGVGGSATAITTINVLPAGIPLAPTNLVANTGAQCGGQIDLTWNISLGSTFYNILRNGSIIATTTNLSFTDTGLTFGQSYSYTVQAVNSLGTSASSNTAAANASAQCGGGGGGGGGGGSTTSSSGGSSSGGAFMPIYTGGSLGYQCSYLKDYLRIDFINDPIEVIKLQVFLKEIEGETGIVVSGIFDQATFDATSRFQIKYQGDVLTPWGYAQGESTGYVYILTQKKINEIVCNKLLYLSSGQLDEINSFNAFLDSLRAQGISLPNTTPINTPTTENTSVATTTGETSGVISQITNNPNVKAVAAVVFAGPNGLRDSLKAIFIFLLVLVAAYVVAEESLKRFLKTDDKNSERLRRLMIIFSFLVASIIVAVVLKYYVIILPTLILLMGLVAFAAWIICKKRNTKQNELSGFSAIPQNIIVTPPPAQQA